MTDQFSHTYNNAVVNRFMYKEPCIPFIHFLTDIYSIFPTAFFSTDSQNESTFFPPQNIILSMLYSSVWPHF